MIRILHIVTYMGRGGLETMLMNYYRNVDRTKVQFDFLVHRDFESDYDKEILELSGKIHHIQRLIPWSNSYKAALKAFFQNHPEYKIVHVHQDCLSAVALKAAKECGVPVRIAHGHSSSQDKNLKYLIKLFYKKRIPKYATDLLACSRKAGEWMFSGAPFEVVQNAIDAKAFSYSSEISNEIRASFNIPKDAFVLGHVGRFAETKNHRFIVEIFKEINRKCNNSRLMLVGDGELMDEIEKLVEALGLSDKVIFTGVRADIPALLQAMDIFVFPSIYEGLPVSIIEAQASGLPCFISDGVPIECKKTDLVTQISLSEAADIWADKILSSVPYERADTYTQIADAGYDITENAKQLENYYLKLWDNN